MRLLTALFLLLATFPASSQAAITAQSICASNAIQSCFILIDGRIEKGDLAKVKATIAGHEGARNVYLNSPGGTLGEALRIGRLLRAEGFSTRIGKVVRRRDLFDNPIPENGLCESSCAYVFMGGVDRRLREGDTLGVHRFFAPGQLMDGDEVQAFSGQLIGYIVAMGVDARLFTLASQTAAEKMLHVTLEQARKTDLVTQYGFGELTLEPLKAGILATSKRMGQMTALEKVDEVKFLCIGGKAQVFFNVVGWSRELTNARKSRFVVRLDGKDYPQGSSGVYKRIRANGASLSAPLSSSAARSLISSTEAELYIGYGAAYGGNYGVRLTLSKMDQRKLAAAFRFCIA